MFLQVIKSSLNPRAPDCFQRTPRRVNIMESSNDSLLTISIDGQGTIIVIKIKCIKANYIIEY